MSTKKNIQPPEKYSKAIIAIHWMSAILIICLFILGKYMSDLDPNEKLSLIKTHAILGLTVFVLTLIRSILFFTTPRPPHLDTGSKWNDFLAIAIHRSFYFLLLAIGGSGMATMISGGYVDAITTASPDLIISRNEIASHNFHSLLAVLLMVLFVMHVAGVIRFNIKHKTNAIKRIS